MVKPAMRIVRRVSGMEDLHRTESTVGEVLPIHAQRYPSFGQHVGRFSVSEKAHTQGQGSTPCSIRMLVQEVPQYGNEMPGMRDVVPVDG